MRLGTDLLDTLPPCCASPLGRRSRIRRGVGIERHFRECLQQPNKEERHLVVGELKKAHESAVSERFPPRCVPVVQDKYGGQH